MPPLSEVVITFDCNINCVRKVPWFDSWRGEIVCLIFLLEGWGSCRADGAEGGPVWAPDAEAGCMQMWGVIRLKWKKQAVSEVGSLLGD